MTRLVNFLGLVFIVLLLLIQGCSTSTKTGEIKNSNKVVNNSPSNTKDINDLLRLARQYSKGETYKDYSKSLSLYRQARALGSGKASYELYLKADNGSKERRELLIEAAQRGVQSARKTLALNYFRGWNRFPKNLEVGEKWAKLARPGLIEDRASGSGSASYELSQLEPEGTPRAKALLIEAAERGYPLAMHYLADYQIEGKKGFQKNLFAAEKLLVARLKERPNSSAEKRMLKRIPGAEKRYAQLKKEWAELKRSKDLCKAAKKPAYSEKNLNGSKVITLQWRVRHCFATITATMNKQGQWDGPYKIVDNKSGFVHVDGTMQNGVFSGFLYRQDTIRPGYNFHEDKSKGTFVLKYKPTINIDSAMNSGFETFDYAFSKENVDKKFTRKVVVSNNRLDTMTEYMDDGTILYEGTALSERAAYFNDLDYYNLIKEGIRTEKGDLSKINTNQSKKYNVIFIGSADYGRFEGRCLYEKVMEPCKYEYYSLIKDSSRYNRYKRIDRKRSRNPILV